MKVVSTALVLIPSLVVAGSLTPSNAPGPTMHTLEEIYQSVSVTQTFSPNAPSVTAGNYAATNLTQVDPDLTPNNIASGVTLFGITGVLNTIPAPMARTGQATSYAPGDDGALAKGVPWPTPRFMVMTGLSSNGVVDNLTGLMWARSPGASPLVWSNAIAACKAINEGGGLGSYADWRLPNRKELESLVDGRYVAPALPNTAGSGQWAEGDPFTGVQSSGLYWSSSAYAASEGAAWAIDLHDGASTGRSLTNECYVWVVRGGYAGAERQLFNVVGEQEDACAGGQFLTGTAACVPVKPGSFHLFLEGGASGTFADDGHGNVTGKYLNGAFFDASGTISYDNGTYALTTANLVPLPAGATVTINYTVMP
jgi:hypothetical protein